MPVKSKGAKQFIKIQEDIETRNKRVFGSGPKEQYVDNQRGIASGGPGKDMKSLYYQIRANDEMYTFSAPKSRKDEEEFEIERY